MSRLPIQSSRKATFSAARCYRRLTQLYKNFSPATATALTISEATRALLDPHSKCSYSQYGEDIIIAKYLWPTQTGFYVDVGCHHPIFMSNTLSLYSRGWHGVVVDGNRELIDLFRRVRPKDIAICAIVSNKEHLLTFTLAKQPNESTVSSEFARRIGESGVKERVEVNAITLQTIMEHNKVPSTFDLLSIDVVGHDYEVLTSFDINAFRPRIIAIAMHGFRPTRPNTDQIYLYLERNHYQLKSYTGINGIFQTQ
jgi:FkbM family methyltransferase